MKISARLVAEIFHKEEPSGKNQIEKDALRITIQCLTPSNSQNSKKQNDIPKFQ